MNDINELVKKLISQGIEKGLDSEVEDELGYFSMNIKTRKLTTVGTVIPLKP